MPNFPLQFDRISFFMGFLAATLFWWVVARIRPMLPVWRQRIRQNLQELSQRNLSNVEDYMRREMLRSAQRQHIAANIFSLDEVLIQPLLLVPPGGQDPASTDMHQSTTARLVPYLPDWPEICASYGVLSIRPDQALHSGRHLVFIGQPGSGKTVAMAHLASQLARRDAEVRQYDTVVPIYFHVLDMETTLEENQDPLDNLIKAVSASANVVMQPQIPRFLRSVFRDKQRRVVLLLDGLDELPAERMTSAVEILSALLYRYPRVQAVVTASAEYLDGLTKAGFYPLPVAAWNQRQRTELTEKWGVLWNEQLLPEAQKQAPVQQIDTLLMEYWLSGENAYASPLEWTMRIWGAYAGDLSGNSTLSILDTHISRFLPSPAFMPMMEDLAHWMIQMPAASVPYDEMEKFLSAIKLPKMAAPPAEMPMADAPLGQVKSAAPDSGQESATPPDEGEQKPRKKSRQKPRTTQGEDIITALLQGGILLEHANHHIRFASPVFFGFLAGMKVSHEEAVEMVKALEWPVSSIAMQYAAACGDSAEWIYPLIEGAEPPLFRGLLNAARWLRDSQPSAEWRSYIMRTLVALIQDETVAPGMRARMIAAFYLSRDPSINKLFKQLLSSQSPVVRRMALLGLGATGSQHSIKDILEMLADSQPEVRHTACMALAAIPGETALSAVVELLLTGDEEIRQAAAEALALNPEEGQKILEEAAGVDDLLTRRAAVFGLVQVRSAWSHKALEKLAVEDGQWVVRNAASQALETLQQSAHAIPKKLPHPSQSPWLLAFASKLGMGILPGKPATDVLLTVLKSGTVEEQIAALYYLREVPDEGVVAAIYRLLYSDQEALSEPVLHALWWMNASGTKLPSPVMFGLS